MVRPSPQKEQGLQQGSLDILDETGKLQIIRETISELTIGTVCTVKEKSGSEKN